MAAPKGRGLGKGLEALFSTVEITAEDLPNEAESKESGIVFLDINEIKPNGKQPRKNFDDEKIEELAASIQVHGIIQPIMVRPAGEGYEIVAGERRWRAARKAALKNVPCMIRELDEEQNLLVALIENIQREDLNPVEEAEAFHQMIAMHGLTQEEVSKSVGKSRPYITNALRLLRLPVEIQELVSSGNLSNGHARALAGIKSEHEQIDLANQIVTEGLSVRETESLVSEAGSVQSKRRQRGKPCSKNADVQRLEDDLREALGTKVAINLGVKKGKIEIEYYSRDELERILELLLSLK